MMRLVRLHTAALEMTLECPCGCLACGSDAGRARKHELDAAEWLAVVDALADLGCRRVTLTGGEPLRRPDWPRVARRARERGLAVDMITSGVGLDAKTLAKIRRAKLAGVTLSVDGTADVHDRLRGGPGRYDEALDAIRRLDRAGLKVGVSTQINRLTLPTLDALAPEIQDAGALGWQFQLTMPAGRAAGRGDLVLAPEEMPEVHRAIRRLQRRRGLRPFVTDNLGWMTRDDPVLRTPQRGPERCWLGCFAGLRSVAIASDGGLKGCLALPDSFVEGNVRERPLAEIWRDPARFAWNRSFDRASLSGACASCSFGPVCRGGCTALAVTVHGRPGVSTHCFRLGGEP